MAERYWITSIQLGCLIAVEKKERVKLADKIVDNQFIGKQVQRK